MLESREGSLRSFSDIHPARARKAFCALLPAVGWPRQDRRSGCMGAAAAAAACLGLVPASGAVAGSGLLMRTAAEVFARLPLKVRESQLCPETWRHRRPMPGFPHESTGMLSRLRVGLKGRTEYDLWDPAKEHSGFARTRGVLAINVELPNEVLHAHGSEGVRPRIRPLNPETNLKPRNPKH